MSEEHYAEAEKGFKEAANSISSIRSHFDAIYKNLKAIRARQKELEALRLARKGSANLDKEITIEINPPGSAAQEESKPEQPEQPSP